MHHQEHQKEHQAHQTRCDLVCHPHDVTLPYEQLHGAFGRTEQQGRATSHHRLHSRALMYKVPLIMMGMQIAMHKCCAWKLRYASLIQ